MSLEFGDPFLEKYILDEIEYLRDYTAQGNVNPQFLEMMNKKILELTDINNGIFQFKYPDAWIHVELCMDQLESVNPRITGHLIEFLVDYRTGNFSKITIPNDLI